jgi:hypothetical protein
MSVAPQPRQLAIKPLMQWTAEGVHGSATPGKVLKNLSALVDNLKPVVGKFQDYVRHSRSFCQNFIISIITRVSIWL